MINMSHQLNTLYFDLQIGAYQGCANYHGHIKQEQLHVRVRANLPGISAVCTIFYSKYISRQCLTLKMNVRSRSTTFTFLFYTIQTELTGVYAIVYCVHMYARTLRIIIANKITLKKKSNSLTGAVQVKANLQE